MGAGRGVPAEGAPPRPGRRQLSAEMAALIIRPLEEPAAAEMRRLLEAKRRPRPRASHRKASSAAGKSAQVDRPAGGGGSAPVNGAAGDRA